MFVFRFTLMMAAYLLITSATLSAEMPDFEGKNYSAVKEEITATGLSEFVEYVTSSKPIGTILVQIPAAGTSTDNQSNIFLRISNGVTVPVLEGMDKVAAQNSLREIGVGLEYVEEQVLGVQNGLVTKQIPTAGTQIDASKDVVFLRISNDSGVKIPNLIGMTTTEAKDLLQSLGLSGAENPPDPKLLRKNDLYCIPYEEKAVVKSSTPNQGSYVARETTVVIHYDVIRVNSSSPFNPYDAYDKGCGMYYDLERWPFDR